MTKVTLVYRHNRKKNYNQLNKNMLIIQHRPIICW